MENINYKKAGAYYLMGNLFNKGIAFLTVPIYTRLLSTTDYGIVTTYNSWISILSIVIGCALYMGIRAAFIDYENKIDDFMSVVTTFILCWGGVLTAIVWLIYNLVKFKSGAILLGLCMLQGLASALIENYLMYLMMQYKYRARTFIMILPNLLSVLLSVFAIALIVKNNKYLGRIVPAALVNIIFGLILIVLIYKKSHILYNKKYLKYGLSISAPLVLHGIALNILSQSDRTMITLLADASQTGIYSLIYNFSMLATVITTSLEGVWTPWFMKKYQKKELEDINALVLDYVHLMTYAMVGLILVGPEIVKLLASKKYWEGIIIIPPVVLSNYIIFIYTLYVNVEHFSKKTIYITVNTLVAAGANLILNFIFIPYFGYVSAAYTTLTAYLVSLILHARYAKKLEKGLYPIKLFLPSLIHITLAILIFYVMMNYGICRWGIASIYISSMFYINRKKLAEVFPSLGEKFARH